MDIQKQIATAIPHHEERSRKMSKLTSKGINEKMAERGKIWHESRKVQDTKNGSSTKLNTKTGWWFGQWGPGQKSGSTYQPIFAGRTLADVEEFLGLMPSTE